ncbi:MAG: flavodoxin domain-containing protein [Candidatus Bathyarchaeota archaeon]|nr:flavodoxin domain-containing protein [Candidatus Bathyarchaeota archaeon]
MSKAIVIYHTKFGNTESIAKALAEGMEEQGVKVDCVKIDEVDVDKLVEYDFLAVGGPTHNLGMSKPMKGFLEELKIVDISDKKGFCFDTRVQSRFNRFDLNSAAKRIEKKMKVKMIKPRKSAIVEGREGPLEKGTQKTFRKLGKEIAELI